MSSYSKLKERLKMNDTQSSTNGEEGSSYQKLKDRLNISDSNGVKSEYQTLKDRLGGGSISFDEVGVDESYLKKFFTDSYNYMNSAQRNLELTDWSTASSAYDKRVSASEDLSSRAGYVRAYINANKDNLSEDQYKEYIKFLDDFSKGSSDILTAFEGTKDFYAQFETEDDYNAWQKKEDFITAYVKDSKKAKAEIKYDEAWLEEAERRKEIAQVKASNDFGHYSKLGVEKGLDSEFEWATTKHGSLELFSNVTNDMVIAYREDPSLGTKKSNLVNGQTYAADSYRFAENMTDDEYAVYTYYYGKDKEKAKAYLKSLEETLNQRAGGKIAKTMQEHDLEWLMAVTAGVDQWASGIKNLDNFFLGTDPDATSAVQYASGIVREDIDSWWGKTGYDLLNTTANQLPNIALSFVPVVGKALSLTSMGLSSAGNAYSEAIKNKGMTAGQAQNYAFLVSASEVGLQYLLGGISSMSKDGGEGIFQTLAAKALDHVDNALARVAIQLGGNMLDEALEESLQTLIEPVFESWVTGEKYNAPDASEVFYSGLLGALSAGMLESPKVAANTVSTIQKGTNVKDVGAVDRLVKLGKTFSADSVAYKLAGKVNEDTGAYTIGRLLNEVGATLSEQNMSEITKSLERKAVPAESAKVLAEYLEKVVEGETLTDKQKSILEMNKATLSKTMMDVIINPNSTVNQRVQGYVDVVSMAKNPSETIRKQNAKAIAEWSSNGAVPTETGVSSVEGETAEIDGIGEVVEGKTILNSTGEEVKVKEISSIKNGEVKVWLEDGREASVKDIDFGNESEGLIYEAVADMNPEAASDLITAFNQGNLGNGNTISLSNYLLGFKNAYRLGTKGIPSSEVARDMFSSKLSEAQQRIAYNRGKTDSITNVKSDQAKVDAKKESAKNAQSTTKTYKSYKGETHINDIKTEGMTERQSASVNSLKVIADAFGMNIYFFESPVVNGKRVGKNGYYNPSDKSIHIDLFAGMDGKQTILFTAAHELTHLIHDLSPAKFKLFADFLFEQYGKKGVSVEELIQAQIQKAKNNGRTISYDEAYQEVVADSCEAMLTDSNAIDKIAKLKAKDKTLWAKIKDFIKDLVGKIKAVYAGLNPDSVEANHVREMKDAAEQLYALWTDALIDAGNAYSAVSAEKTLTENGIAVNSDTNSASLMSVRDVLSDEQRNKVSTALATRFGVTKEEAMDWLKAETSMASLILNPKYSQYLDYTADPNEVAIKQNADYPQGTVDFSPICEKRREFTSVMNNILRLFHNHVFAATDLAKIRSIMQEEGMTIPCGICYVEDRRQLDTIVAQNFIDSLKLYREGSKTRPDGKAFNTNQLKGLKLIDGDSYTPSVYELVSLEGLNALKEKNPNMAEAWVKFNNARGMQSVRLLANEAEYKRQILKYSKSTVKSKNDKGGLRVYSFSDAEMFHLIDIIQVITDSATVGLSLQGYTKVNEYAKTVKDTGEKLNRSLIPKGELGYHIENGKVVLDYDTVEGIDINHPDFFDNRDNPNVGNITIGVSDVQIRAAMVSDFVDQIIPFHTGQSEEVLGEKGISTWSNYKDFQTEKDIATGKVSDHQVNIYTEVLQVLEEEGKPITKRTFVEKFLQVCKENDLTPRFSQFLNTNAKGEYVYTEGYHKMLVDFKTFAQTKVGEYLPQMPVKPIFDDKYITKILKDYVKSQKVKDAEISKSMPKVIERITNEIVKPSDVKLSDRATSWRDVDKIQGLEGYSVEEVTDIVRQHIENIAMEYGDDIEIVAIRPYGSRARGTAKNSSDLDVVVQFEGDVREDDMFNMLNDDDGKLVIDGIEVDINPIKADDTGTIEEYLDRVYSYDKYSDVKLSDRDSVGNQLSKEQQEYFKDSQVRDKNGKLMVVYHGSGAEFNEFLHSKIGQTGSAEGRGFYFTDNAEFAKGYQYNGVALKQGYLNISKPLSDSKKTLKRAEIKKLLETLDPTGDDIVINYDRMGGVGYPSRAWYTRALNDTVNAVMEYSDTDSDMLAEIANSGAGNKKVLTTIRSLFGYDGYIVEGKYPNTTVYVSFESNQFKNADNKTPTTNPDIRYSLRGTNKDGIEVYETSEEVKKMPYKERMDTFKAIMEEQYKGRTAKFIRNGHAYYALFDGEDVDKNIYGDKKSDTKGWKAKVNVGADGNIFELVENAQYNGSRPETGKKITAHRNVGYWDYFIKTVQIDDTVFDLVANVRKKPNNSFVYSIQLKVNKKVEASPSLGLLLKASNRMLNASTDNTIAQESDSVKSFSKNSQKLSDRDLAPTFYSQMGKVVEGIKQDKFAANSVVSMLRGRGVKAEEIRWSGIVTWLEGKKSVTKQELLEFINSSMLQIGEQVSGNDIDLRYNAGERSYTLYDNGGNVIDTYTYNEFLGGYVSEIDEEIYSDANELEEAVREEYGEMSSPRWSQYKLNGGENYREIVFTMPNSTYSNRAMRGHWGQDAEGVLVHARIQDFIVNGKKMLFIEEIQSDWHNEGHSKGYSTKEYEDAVATHDKLYNKYKKIDLALKKYIRSNDFMTDPEDVRKKKTDWLRGKAENAQKKYLDAAKVINSLQEKGAGDTPDAPFKDTYHEFVLKRLLRMAAEQGYDSIGWTPADIQSKRWSDEYAEGYRIEYDQDMPKFLKKYGRQWGATVGYDYIRTETVDKSYYDDLIAEAEADIANYKQELEGYTTEEYEAFCQEGISDLQNQIEVLRKQSQGEKVWAMNLTDSMKNSVLHEGQVLYSDRNTSSLIGKEVMAYKEGDAKPDLTLVNVYNERTGKTETTIKFVGDRPKGYIPEKIAYCYKLFEQHPDETLHALFAGASKATPIGEWQYAQGFPYTDSGVKGMNLRERYGWHLSAGLPSAPHLMSSKDFTRGYPSKNAFGHPKGSKRVWVRMAYDASTDFNSIADSTKAGDIFGLIPFGGYYAFKENNQSEWVISSAVKIDKILTEKERQQILQDAGYDEYEAWRKKHFPTEEEKAESKRKSAENKKAKDLAKKEGKNYLSESAKEMRETIKSRIIDNPELSGVKYSDRDSDSMSNRSLLANALESAVQNDIERNKLEQYKAKIDLINAEEQKLQKLSEEIKQLYFTKGARNDEKIRNLQFERKQTINRINTYDRQLLTLEASKPLKAVLEREKTMAYKRAEQKGREALSAYREKAAKTQRELMTRYQESRAKATESRHKTELRNKIKDVVSKLNQLLLRPTKDKHVKEGLKTAVAEALSAINMDTVGAEARIAELNKRIAKANDPIVIESLTESRDRIELQGENLKDKLTALQTAYEKVKNSTDPELKNAYQEPVMNAIKNVVDMVGGTPLRDMSLYQLEAVYEMYKMVLHTVRTANKAFKANKGETITQLSEAVCGEIRTVGKEKFKRNPLAAWLRKTGWTLLKPFTAFRTMGSNTFTGLFTELRNGEDVYYVDINEAKEFIQNQYKKHNFKEWDKKKTYTFTAKSGKTFTLTLEQVMSLYAYSRRNQAHDHIIEGGIVLEDSVIVEKKLGIPVKYKVDTKSAFNISEEVLQEICNSLTDEQRAFVNEMQAYLSDVMGAKGNEVSMELLGVELFKEKFYFPIKSSKYYMGFKPEEAGEIKLKNSSFSKETVQHANNPVVLQNFSDVWATHINDMSMYHAFVLPLEDFTRVYNYKTRTDALLETMSTEATIANAYGEGATQYIRNFLKSLNGGVRIDGVGIADKMIGLTKKGAVLASASVTIQQPSAIMRAMALINPIHFVTSAHKSINLVKHKQAWAELKTYAPIAGIKEMGGYDIGMGQGTVNWIKDQSTFREKVDDVLGKAPALMDEITWVSIWNAVKRETASKNKGMDVNSEAFLKKAGERFTEVISMTQVYDSVFSRSDIMRNANPLAKMLTAFMAEPTTTLNMLVDSFIQGKRTGKVGGFVKATAGTGGAVVAAIVFNAALKSIITAMRDDDDDETYAEKYLGAFVGNALDDLNPLSYIPFVKDVVSIFNGYDVERMDMALFSDLKQAIDAFDSDSKSEYEKWSGLIGATAAFFGVPVKNVERDIRGAVNTIQSFINGEKTTGEGVKQSIKGAVTGEKDSNAEQLYDAIVRGDQAHANRVMGRYEDQDAVEKALRNEAKKRYLAEELDSDTAMRFLIDHCGMEEDDAYWKVQEWEYELANGDSEDYAKYGSFYEAVKTGKNIKAVIKEYTDNGVSNQTLASQITSHFKPLYKEMTNSERASIKGYLLNAYALLGYDRAKKSKDIDKWLEEE